MTLVDNPTAAKLIDLLGRLRKPFYDDPDAGQIARKHNFSVLYARIGIAEKSGAPDYLIETSKNLMIVAGDINELVLEGKIRMVPIETSRLLSLDADELQRLTTQERIAGLVREVCLLLATRYLNEAMAIKIKEENRQFGGH